MTSPDISPAQVVELVGENSQRHMRSLWKDPISHILRDRLTLIALTVLVVLSLLCFLGPPVVENVMGVNVNRTNISN